MNIRVKIGTAMILLSLIVSITIGFFANLITRDIIRRRSEGFLTTIVNEKVSAIESNLFSVNKLSLNMFNEFIDTYNFQSKDQEYINKYLNKFELTIILNAEQNSSNSAFIVLLTDGEDRVIWYEDHNLDGVPEKVTSPDQKQELLNIVNNAAGSEWIIDYENFYATFFKYVLNENGELIAVVGMNFKLVEIIRHIHGFEYLSTGKIFLTTEEGIVIYHPDKRNNIIQNAEITGPGAFLSEQDENGEEIIFSSIELSNGWVLTIFISKKDLYSELNRITEVISILVLFSILVIVIFSLITSRLIAEPYKYLTTTIESIGGGNYNINIEKSYFGRSDEVGILSRAIQEMVKLQKNSFEKIKNYNINLEGLVKDRTKELLTTNSALEESLSLIKEKQRDLRVSNDQLENSLIEIKETRKELIKTEKIASSRYIAIGIAHNMNTPLGNIITMISFLSKKKDDFFNDYENNHLTKAKLNDCFNTITEVCERIESNNEQMKSLIEKLQNLSKIKFNEDVKAIDIGKSVEIIVDHFMSEHQGISFEINVTNDSNQRIKCDSLDLHKIIYELIDNSITHGFKGIESPKIDIEIIDHEDESVGISYKDNGIGVDHANIQEVFTPLFTTKLGQNHGLGLAMVHHLVLELFHGVISFKSEKENGIEIIIRLYQEKIRK